MPSKNSLLSLASDDEEVVKSRKFRLKDLVVCVSLTVKEAGVSRPITDDDAHLRDSQLHEIDLWSFPTPPTPEPEATFAAGLCWRDDEERDGERLVL